MFQPFTGLAEEKRRAAEGSPIVSRPAPALVCPRGPRPVLSLHLGQVDRQVVHEPAVAGAEALGLGRLGVPHDAVPGVDLMDERAGVECMPPALSGEFRVVWPGWMVPGGGLPVSGRKPAELRGRWPLAARSCHGP